MRNCSFFQSLTRAIALVQSSSDLGASPLLANLTAGQIAQYAAAHVAQQQQLQQRSSAFSPVQQTDSQAGVQAAASLAVGLPSGKHLLCTLYAHIITTLQRRCYAQMQAAGFRISYCVPRRALALRHGLHVRSLHDIRPQHVEGVITCCGRPWR